MTDVKGKRREPIGKEEDLKPYISCIDHTVSRETFSILLDPNTDLLITHPRPKVEDLPAYYESEEYISHTDSKRTLLDKVYQIIKNYSLKRKLKLINRLAGKKGSMLDIGCGTGDLLSVCENDGWNISGVEPNSKARELAGNKIAGKEKIHEDLNSLFTEGKKVFDIITMWHVLEHVPNLREHIEKLEELLAPDGYLIIAVPNFKSFDANHYKEFWAAYDVPRHLWHFSEKSIRDIFGQYGFDLIDTQPLIFDSFYVSLLSEKYKTGKSNIFSAFRTGLISNIKAKQSGEYSSKIYILKKG